MKLKRVTLFLIFFSLGYLRIFAQNPGLLNVSIETECILSPEAEEILNSRDRDINDFIEENRNILLESLSVAFRNDGFDVIFENQFNTGMNAQSHILKGEESGLDLVINGSFFVQETRVIIQVQVYDVYTGNLIAVKEKNSRWDNIGLISSLNQVTFSLIADLQDEKLEIEYYKENPDERDNQRPARILLTPSQSGVEIFLLGSDELIGITDTEVIELPYHPIPNDQEIVLLLKKEGYYDSEISVTISEPDIELRLSPLKQKTKDAVITSWNLSQFYGLNGAWRRYFIEDSLYMNLGGAFFLSPALNDDEFTFMHFDIQALIGYYIPFGKQSSPFRIGLSIGVGNIFSFGFGPEKWFYYDFYINWLNVYVELNFSKVAFYVSIDNRFAFGGQNAILSKGSVLPAGGEFPLLSVGVVWKIKQKEPDI